MFAKTAAFYDRVYAAIGKDYAREASAIVALARAAAPGAGTLLDAGCGTGAHLEAFERAGFACRGFDLDLNMVKLARARCPEANIQPGDLLTYDGGERFDIVTCLFGAIAYVRTPERLALAIAHLASLLAPGGQLFVEPFIGPDEFVPGKPHAIFVDEPDLKLSRMNVSKKIGRIAIIDFHYTIATGPGGVEREFERHEVGLFTEAEYAAAFSAAALNFEALALPAFPRGLFRGRGPLLS